LRSPAEWWPLQAGSMSIVPVACTRKS
jgi:hypothetical protein